MTAMASEPSTVTKRQWQALFDVFGAFASIACAVHCAALPLLFAFFPMLNLGFLHNHRFDYYFALAAIGFAALVLLLRPAKEAIYRILFCFIAGTIFLLLGIYQTHSDLNHAILFTLGGIFIGLAHLINLHYLKRYKAQ